MEINYSRLFSYFLGVIVFSVQSCHVEKRVHTSGYHVTWKHFQGKGTDAIQTADNADVIQLTAPIDQSLEIESPNSIVQLNTIGSSISHRIVRENQSNSQLASVEVIRESEKYVYVNDTVPDLRRKDELIQKYNKSQEGLNFSMSVFLIGFASIILFLLLSNDAFYLAFTAFVGVVFSISILAILSFLIARKRHRNKLLDIGLNKEAIENNEKMSERAKEKRDRTNRRLHRTGVALKWSFFLGLAGFVALIIAVISYTY